MWTAVEQKEYGSDPHSYEHYLSNSEKIQAFTALQA